MTVLTNTNSPYRTGTMKIQELAKAEILQGVMRLAVKAELQCPLKDLKAEYYVHLQ